MPDTMYWLRLSMATNYEHTPPSKGMGAPGTPLGCIFGIIAVIIIIIIAVVAINYLR